MQPPQKLLARIAMLITVLWAMPAVAQTEADLAVSKSGPATAAAGSDVTFSITMTNGGPDDALSPNFNDPLPAGMTFVSVTQNTGPAATCSDPGVGSGGTVSCSLASLPAGQSATFSLVANIPGSTVPGTTFTNIVSVSSESFDPNAENNSGVAVVSTPGPPQADVGVTKTGPSSAAPDTDVSYAIIVTNGGPDTATNVLLQDTLPGTMTFVSFSQNGSPLACTTPAAGSGGTFSCTSTSLPSGASTTLTLTGHIPAGTPAGTSFTNTATIASDDDDPNGENDIASTTFSVSAVDLSVTKVGPPAVNAGNQISYTITVANAGPDAAVLVAMSDTLPAGTTFVSLSQNNGPAASCATPPPSFGGSVSCFWNTLPSSASAQFILVLNSGSTVTAINTVTITSENADTNPANNSATAITAVSQVSDLGVTKIGPSGIVAGSNVTYTVTLTNAGPSTASSVVLTDVLPAGTTFVSQSQTSGPSIPCVTPPAGSGGTITCSTPSLAPGASAAFTFVINVPFTATGSISNTATIASGTTDPNVANNSSTATTNISIAPTDVRIVKTANPGIYATGLPVTYTISVTNLGPAPANATDVTDVLPAGTAFVSATPSQGSCSGTSTVTCNLGTLASSASATITLVLTLPSTPGAISNTATVTTPSGDTNAANDSSTATITVISAALVPATSTLTLLLMALGIAVVAVWLRGSGQ